MWKKLFSSLVPMNGSYPEQSSSADIKLKEENIPSNLEITLDIFKSIYSIPDNRDAKIRELKIREWDKKAAVIFISTITDVKVVEERIIEPLLHNKDSQNKIEDIVTTQTINSLPVIKDVLTEINRGNTVLFVDGHPQGYIFDTSSFQSRAIGIAESEVILKGPKEAFIEKAAINISLIRKKIRNENLLVESMTVSKRSKNEVFMMYVFETRPHKYFQYMTNRGIETGLIPESDL
jgi:spore germination protein KA